jgi:hypothetical protein
MSEETPSERIRRKIREGRGPASRDIKRLHEERIKRKPEDLERKAEEARREEQRIKEELKQTQLEGLRAYIRLLAHALDDERTALGVYDELIRNATATYDKRELEIILAEERQHKARLEALISEREHEFKSLTYRKG